MFLVNLKEEFNIDIEYSNIKKEKKILETIQQYEYPTVASIEITHKCNLKCRHCYGKYGADRQETVSLENIKKFLHDFKAIGGRVVEFTGGDITMHPNLKEIVLEAVKLDFQQIALLTNGIALTKEVMDIVIKNKERFIVQIDLHSLDDGYLYWFTQAKNTLDTIKEKINILNSAGVMLRIATVVTQKNLSEVEAIAEYVYNLGIKAYAVSLVIDIGRSLENKCDNNENLLLLETEEQVLDYDKQLYSIMKKYPGFLNIIEDPQYSSPNCGALKSNISITPNGDIKLCTMDNCNYFNSSIGNVFTTNIKDIYDENIELLNAYSTIQSPDANSEECKDCENRYFCGHCMLRGIIRAKEKGDECKWFKKNMLDIVKEKFSL